MNRKFRLTVLALALGTALTGCASLAPRVNDHHINELLTARHGPKVEWSSSGQPLSERQAIGQWLSVPMTADSAVRVAMLRSPRLQREYARLGLARAEVLEAVQIANPRLSLSRLAMDPGTGSRHSTGLALPLVDLLVLPVRARLAKAEYERAQLEIAGAVLGVAADVEAGWYRHVGAQQVAEMRTVVAGAADASAELAQRFFDAGNISELQLRQEQAAASEARIASARARAELNRSRLALNTLIGLSGDEANWATADRLPMPVAIEDDPSQLLELARTSNLELLAARQQALILTDALGITRSLRWLGGSEIGYERENETGGTRLRGPTLDLELPIFNQGQAKLARAEALLAEARARIAMAELGVDNAVRLGAQEVRELGKVVSIHRESLVPQREKVVVRSQQEQNFMLIGVFELIQAKVKEYDAYQGYLESVRDYWLARVELMRAVGQRLPSDASITTRTPGVQDILKPATNATMPGMAHSGHRMPPAADAATGQDMSGMDHSGHDMPKAPVAPAKPAVDHSRHGAPPAAEPTPPVDAAPKDEDKDDSKTEDHSAHGGTP